MQTGGLGSAEETHVSTDQYFVMLRLPGGPKPLVSETEDPNDPKVCLFDTYRDAKTEAMQSRAGTHYGFDVFRMGYGVELDD
jgi:hypothetical protein